MAANRHFKKKRNKDNILLDMDTGDADEDVYREEARGELVEDDEISPEEEGFMEGYEHGEQMSKCARCDRVLTDDFIEEKINGKVHRFCSESCAERFSRKRRK